MTSLKQLQTDMIGCARCPELRAYLDDIAATKRKAYLDEDYWSQPVPSFGDSNARLVIVGLAPGAHGANRTGRMFTGDRSGDFLYAALHRAGLSNQPESIHRGDGLRMKGVFITNACRCAPPANKPTAGQQAECLSWIVQELELLRPRVMLCLGAIGFRAALQALKSIGAEVPRPQPRFGHGSLWDAVVPSWADAAHAGSGTTTVMGCYHVSQQNTFTGRLTEAMLDEILRDAKGRCAPAATENSK